ncbi:hypothetical protein ACLX1H_001044 [Fusarium chlamydosporum]
MLRITEMESLLRGDAAERPVWLLSTIILAFPLAVASWPHIEACRKAWPAEPCAYIAGNAMVLGACESVCETNNCPNNLVFGNRGSTYGIDYSPTIL